MRVLRLAEEGIPFIEILLDETICAGKIAIPQELVRKAGGINQKLQAKRKYELILRIAYDKSIVLEELADKEVDEDILVFSADEEIEDNGWQTDCYVLGKYSRELREAGYFDVAIQGLLIEAESKGNGSEVLAFLEQMIGQTEAYHQLDAQTRPILIYKGDPVCHNVLTVFAEQFGKALEQAGENVIYYDLEKEDVAGVLRYMHQHFKAIIGVQSYLFSVKLADEVHYVHEYIYGPKFNFVFDHPIWMQKHLMHQYPDYYILTLDQNYADFAKRYFNKQAICFPPAGMMAETSEETERKYDLTFVGTMGDYIAQAQWIHEQDREKRFLANRFLLIMRKNPNMTLEAAFAEAVKHQGLNLTDEEFMRRLREICVVGYCVMHYYRYKTVETILKAGIQLDVFGNSWLLSPLCKYPNLICHPDVTVEESLTIWRESKLSLNVMSWHKGGFTERMAGIMLADTVLVTDDTTYLRGRYDEDDMLIFKLEELEKLPGQIKKLLSDDKKRQEMAHKGKEKTLRDHTWQKRAEQFLEILKDTV